jgi:hypothetical protein
MRNERTLTLDLAEIGQSGHIVIRNPMWLKQRDLTNLQNASSDPAILASFLSNLIEGWELSDFDGSPIPYVRGVEGIEELPLIIVRFVFERVASELNVPLGTVTS